MNLRRQLPCSKPHKVTVVMGYAAVAAYLDGETKVHSLAALGAVQVFSFQTLQEANAFMYGVEVASQQEDAMAVDDLIE